MVDYTDCEISDIVFDNMDAILLVSAKENIYHAKKCSETIAKIIPQTGSYEELIEKLWFHMSGSDAKITDEYQVFLPKFGEFKGKATHKINLEIDGVMNLIQTLVCPINQEEGEYVIILCILDQSEAERDVISDKKVKTIQETYLFSMYVDLNKDITNSINVSEMSDDDLHYDVKYSEWRNMIVHTIWPEDQPTFMEKSDPEYLRAHLKPGKTLSFDCQMKNLKGEYIWVKLTFGRSETTSKRDFRFVFMVQNIHEESVQLFEELKKFETMASYDALTAVYNRGRIETELNNAIGDLETEDKPVSLMMLDVDYFKKINDTHGHAVGDEILKGFVKSVSEILQDYDIEIGRWGGEEFVCVCYDLDMDALVVIAEQIRKYIASNTYETVDNMTCSIGLANIYKDDTAKTAFERVDKALYDAKASGRNCVKMSEE